MSSGAFLWGNVDEEGRAEAESEELKLIAEYSDVLTNSFGLGKEILDNDSERDAEAEASAGTSEAADQDVEKKDFYDETELAEDNGLSKGHTAGPTPALQFTPVIQRRSIYDEDDDYDDEDETDNGNPGLATTQELPLKESVQPNQSEEVYDRARLLELFPGYDEGVIRMTDSLITTTVNVPKPTVREHTRKPNDQFYPVREDDREKFHQRLPLRVSAAANRQASLPATAWDQLIKNDNIILPNVEPLVIDSWEENIIWSDDDERNAKNDIVPRSFVQNNRLENDAWEMAIIWDAPSDADYMHTDVPALLSGDEEVHATQGMVFSVDCTTHLDAYAVLTDDGPLDKYNLSDDRKYEELQSTATAEKVRQTAVSAILQHSTPAVNLHLAYFKLHHTVKEMRSFHRPALKFPINQELRFTRVRGKSKKEKRKAKGKDVTALMETPNDLTLKDNSKFALLEYSEEYPPILQNTGMGSFIQNYYRKMDEEDAYIPEEEIGRTYILGPKDASPFFLFGEVESGQTLQGLDNHLFRAPIFRQQAAETDFLVIRHTYKGDTKYFIREIPFLYVVGQTFPLQDVPRPQSRLITKWRKGRMIIMACRLMHADKNKKIPYAKLRKYFSFMQEITMKQKLKEFAQFDVKGSNTGFWKLKPVQAFLSEEEIQKFVTPENVCLLESMQVGQQRLRDAGYGDEYMQGEEEDESMEKDEHADIEVALAPWTITKNFTLASVNKGMLKLYGPGDPTGRGEAFSFLRASMKEMFLRPGESAAEREEAFKNAPKYAHRYTVAEQQAVYREEIKRIWERQLASLSRETPPDEEEDAQVEAMAEEEEMNGLQRRQTLGFEREEAERRRDWGGGSPMPMQSSLPSYMNRHDDRQYSDEELDETASIAESQISRQTGAKGKEVLLINRLIREGHWEKEYVTDPRVIKLYLQKKKLQEMRGREGTPKEGEPEKKRRGRKKKEDTGAPQEKRKYTKRKVAIEGSPNPEMNGSSSQAPVAHPAPKIKLSISYPPPEPTSPPNKRKRSDSIIATDAADYLQPIHPKSYGRRRARPEVELAEILGGIVQKLIDDEHSLDFCRPVSSSVKGYYDIVKNPITLEVIRDRNKNFIYKSAAAFLGDIQLLASNARLFNGPAALHTQTAEKYLAMAERVLQRHADDLARIEQEVIESQDQPIPLVGSGSPTRTGLSVKTGPDVGYGGGPSQQQEQNVLGAYDGMVQSPVGSPTPMDYEDGGAAPFSPVYGQASSGLPTANPQVWRG
ncbi:hypothetical protein HDV00_006144 [Rhizophlyctis rosea]|nr:hypothetical protein HDV00_006144 [Rhizophlyctis rosea]